MIRNNDYKKERQFLPTVKLEDDPVFAKIPKTGQYNKNFCTQVLKQIAQKCHDLRDEPHTLNGTLTTSISKLLALLEKDPSK